MTMANKARAPLDFVNPEAAEAARTGTLNMEIIVKENFRIRYLSLI